jgi:hypothetical protein
MNSRLKAVWPLAGASALAIALCAAPALAREVYDDLYFVKPSGTGQAMLQDRTECRRVAQGLGDTASSYSNPQYGAFNAMGSALDEDALHEGGLHGRMQRAIFEDCMKRHGWTPLQPQGEDAKAVQRASLHHPEALDAWLKAHEPTAPPPAAKPVVVAAAVPASTSGGSAPASARSASALPRLYAVTFEVNTDGNGKVSAMSVSKVTDPYSGTTDPIKLDVPGEFIAASRDQLLKRGYPPNQHFYTYIYYDPQRPTKGDIDPGDNRQ